MVYYITLKWLCIHWLIIIFTSINCFFLSGCMAIIIKFTPTHHQSIYILSSCFMHRSLTLISVRTHEPGSITNNLRVVHRYLVIGIMRPTVFILVLYQIQVSPFELDYNSFKNTPDFHYYTFTTTYGNYLIPFGWILWGGNKKSRHVNLLIHTDIDLPNNYIQDNMNIIFMWWLNVFIICITSHNLSWKELGGLEVNLRE